VGEERAIELFEDRQALDLLLAPDAATGTIRCVGARTLDRHTGEMQEFRARVTLLATGGLGRVYRHTTNPDIATGDGVAMAWRAGARVANLEFVQFHPTALYPAEDRAVLISEAVRGEGAVLLRMDGSPLMEGLHPLGSLATRDVVARAIDSVLKETGDPHVLLDLSPIRPETIEQRFPSIFAETQARGLDIRREPIPVVPAAHYACGGVQTDWSGRTSLPGLFAVGEVAHTGVHGANRLASNSLLEAVVYSHRCAEEIGLELVRARPAEEAYPAVATDGRGAALAAEELEARAREIRSLMWEDAGIVRSDDRLAHAERRLGELQLEVEAESVRAVPTPALAELRNLCEVAWLIVRSARSRRESRGLHFNRDHPHGDNERFLRDTVLVR
jgi:L-aspartate oxidase